MSNFLDQLILKLKPEVRLSLKISFGIFLFILFFRPLAIEDSDFNDLLLVVSGFGIILFIIIVVVRVLFTWLFDRRSVEEAIFPAYLNGFIIFFLSSVAFAFYAHFVGSVPFTFFVAFRIIVICLIPPVVLSLHDSFIELRQYNELLIAEKKQIQKHIEKYEEDILNKSIEFISENSNENLSLLVSEVVYIKSADNYVEIVYKEDEDFRKKLIRNTLRSIELQLKQYSNFFRCHRSCIVNIHYVEKLHRSSGNNWLSIKGSEGRLPVSRQYLLRIGESI